MTPDVMILKIKEVWALLSTPFIELSGTKVSLANFLISIVFFLFSFKLGNFTATLVTRYLSKKAVDSGIRDSIGRFTRYGVIILGVIFSLDVLGFSLHSLAALGAVLMVGIGFGLQNITQNFISGIIILIERPIKVGDIVQIGNTRGKVIDIHVRSTIVQTRDDISIIVPNSKIVAEDVINESFYDQKIRLHVSVGVAYGSNLEDVQATLLKSALSHPKVLKSPLPLAIFQNFGESSLEFDLRFWTEEIWESDRVSSDVRLTIDSLFREKNISIPFPQRDLHLKRLEVQQVAQNNFSA